MSNRNVGDQYEKVSFNIFKEIKVNLKRYIFYPAFGMEKVQKFIRKKDVKLSFIKKNPQMISERPGVLVLPLPDHEDVYYLIMYKAACSSIMKAILHIDNKSLEDSRRVREEREIALDNLSNLEHKEFFTFVRNPFPKLVSCYTDRVLRVDSFRYLFDGRLAASQIHDFKEFAKVISSIPDDIADGHFCSQSYLLSTKDGTTLSNCYIGHFESLVDDFEPLRKKYGFDELKYVNKSARSGKNWKDYYDLETMDIVYNRYKNDFELYGYTDEYQKLKDYIDHK
ncbi:MAG: sulfotransferase family protein [Lachnospiraceae bacterium]|nr:sulfotransferase family protein [Lachnospiraceae bacterium]